MASQRRPRGEGRRAAPQTHAQIELQAAIEVQVWERIMEAIAQHEVPRDGTFLRACYDEHVRQGEF